MKGFLDELLDEGIFRWTFGWRVNPYHSLEEIPRGLYLVDGSWCTTPPPPTFLWPGLVPQWHELRPKDSERYTPKCRFLWSRWWSTLGLQTWGSRFFRPPLFSATAETKWRHVPLSAPLASIQSARRLRSDTWRLLNGIADIAQGMLKCLSWIIQNGNWGGIARYIMVDPHVSPYILSEKSSHYTHDTFTNILRLSLQKHNHGQTHALFIFFHCLLGVNWFPKSFNLNLYGSNPIVWWLNFIKFHQIDGWIKISVLLNLHLCLWHQKILDGSRLVVIKSKISADVTAAMFDGFSSHIFGWSNPRTIPIFERRTSSRINGKFHEIPHQRSPKFSPFSPAPNSSMAQGDLLGYLFVLRLRKLCEQLHSMQLWHFHWHLAAMFTMTGNGKHSTYYINGDDWGMVYYCFNHITKLLITFFCLK